MLLTCLLRAARVLINRARLRQRPWREQPRMPPRVPQVAASASVPRAVGVGNPLCGDVGGACSGVREVG